MLHINLINQTQGCDIKGLCVWPPAIKLPLKCDYELLIHEACKCAINQPFHHTLVLPVQ